MVILGLVAIANTAQHAEKLAKRGKMWYQQYFCKGLPEIKEPNETQT